MQDSSESVVQQLCARASGCWLCNEGVDRIGLDGGGDISGTDGGPNELEIGNEIGSQQRVRERGS